MTTLTDLPNWSDVIQIETTDDVIGGAGGIANQQAQSLANRTKRLKNSPIVTVTDATYTIGVADELCYIRTTGSSTTTITVPTNTTSAIAIGSSVCVRQSGTGQVVIAGAGGVTVNTSETLKARKQHSSLMLTKVAANEWDLTGDLEALP